MKKENFETWINSVPVGVYSGLRKEIIENCGISDYLYRNWKSGRSVIPLLSKKEINAIALKYELTPPFTV